MKKGLYIILAEKTQLCEALRATARDKSTSPQDSHDAEVRAVQLSNEITKHVEDIHKLQRLCRDMDEMIRSLENIQIPGNVNRMMAWHHLEDAQSRLYRELGNPSVLAS